MENYLINYDHYTKKIVYDFKIGDGGIGDCIKFFLYALNLCIKYEIKLYYLINNIDLKKHLKLRNEKMYIQLNELSSYRLISESDISKITTSEIYNIIRPEIFYTSFIEDKSSINRIFTPVEKIFYFSDEVIYNSRKLLNIDNYISLHLRIGDAFLETDIHYVQCKNDKRLFNELKLFKFIEQNKNIVFFCDNKSYKLKIKKLYDDVIITNANIGHTSLANTTDMQVLDAITEFYLIANSQKIVAASNYSGFSELASKYKGIELQKLDDIIT